MKKSILFNTIQALRKCIYTGTMATVLLFFCSCDSDDEVDNQDPDFDTTEFIIDISGGFSRDMQGTNATYKFNEMPGNFVTSHQLAIYLTDGEGYTVIATILVDGATEPSPGTYNVTDWSSGFGLQPLDAGLSFGQNGEVSHNSAGSSIGRVSILETRDGFLSGSLAGALTPTQNGSGSISLNGTFQAVLDP